MCCHSGSRASTTVSDDRPALITRHVMCRWLYCEIKKSSCAATRTMERKRSNLFRLVHDTAKPFLPVNNLTMPGTSHEESQGSYRHPPPTSQVLMIDLFRAAVRRASFRVHVSVNFRASSVQALKRSSSKSQNPISHEFFVPAILLSSHSHRPRF